MVYFLKKPFRLNEFIVIVNHVKKINNNYEKIYVAKLIDVNNYWALLKIKPLDINELCPPNPAPKRVTHLPINPSLTNPTAINLKSDFYKRSQCHIVSFETAKNGNIFFW